MLFFKETFISQSQNTHPSLHQSIYSAFSSSSLNPFILLMLLRFNMCLPPAFLDLTLAKLTIYLTPTHFIHTPFQ